MVLKQILDDVYDYIKSHKNYNKRQVEQGMKNLYSRLTVRDAIGVLLANGKVSYHKDKPRGFYHLFVDDKNEFNSLINEIDNVLKLANDLTKFVTNKADIMQKVRTRFPKSNTFDVDFRNLVHLTQLCLYGRTSAISAKINDNIEYIDDREDLHLRLSKVLTASDKLNKIIMPQVLEGVKETVNKMGEIPIAPETTWYRIFEGLMIIARRLF